MNNVRVKVEEFVEKEKWTEFLNSIDSYKLFNAIEYYEILKTKIFFVTASDENGLLIGGTICRVRGDVFPFSFLSKSIWIESGLLVANNGDDKSSMIRDMMLKSIIMEARRRGCVIIQFNHWCYNESEEILTTNKFSISYNATFIQDLDLADEKLHSKLDRNIKAALKKARKSNLKFRLADHNNILLKTMEFYEIYKSTQARAAENNKNISMTLKPLDLIIEMLSKENLNCFFAYVDFEDKLVAGIILIKNGCSLIGYIAASNIEINRQYGASSFLFWESMMWAKSQGYKYFDFGGVPNNPEPDDPAFGVYRFKKNFGGNLKQFPVGQLVLSPLRSRLFKRILNSRSIVRFAMKFSTKF